MLNKTLTDKGFFRIKDWWWSKASLLMGMVYLCIAWFNISFQKFILLALLSIITIAGFASVGYLINDFFDRKKDSLAGKKNFLTEKSSMIIALCFVFSAFFLFLPWLYLPFNQTSLLLIAAELILFLTYSLPYIRLKEKGFTGIVADAGYAHVIPVVLAGYTFSLAAGKPIPLLQISLLISWQLLSGIRNILLHQHDDLVSDAKAGNNNWVAKKSESFFNSSIKYLMIGEVVMSLSFFISLFFQNKFFLLCALIIGVWAAITFLRFKEKRMNDFLKTHWRHFPNNVYEKWLPAIILFILSLADIRFLVVLLLHILLFNFEFYSETYKYIYPVLRDTWTQKISVAIKSALSACINYPIYFFFLLLGVDLRKKNLSAMGYLKNKFLTK